MGDNPVFDRIKTEVASEDVVLFMKGTACIRNAASPTPSCRC